MEDLGPKTLQLLYGLLAFVAVVAILVLVVDRAPRKGREWYQLAFFIIPAVALLCIGLVYPSIRTIILSFKDAHGDAWVGWDNYAWMFNTDGTRVVIRNTLVWVALAPLFATGIGLIYALLIDKSKAESLQKTFVFMPMAISFVGAGIIWTAIYAFRPKTADQIGLLNAVWVKLGGDPQQWLLTPPWNTLFLIIVMIWIQAGFAMVVLSAAIKNIPAEIIEAAKLDGVNAWQMFWRVTLPSIRPAVVVVYITILIGVLKVFDIVRTMTGGNYDTSVVANELYTQAFRAGQSGHGSALAVFLLVTVLPIVYYQIRQVRRERSIR